MNLFAFCSASRTRRLWQWIRTWLFRGWFGRYWFARYGLHFIAGIVLFALLSLTGCTQHSADVPHARSEPVVSASVVSTSRQTLHPDHAQDALMTHPNDPVKRLEHEQMLDLVPLEQVTHAAIASGGWSDANSWDNGVIPTDDAHVLVPSDITITYDQSSTVRLASVRVDGELTFATDTNTKIVVDTFVISPVGTLKIGTPDDPIASTVTAEILFADNGEIDLDTDPTRLGRGLISHGNVQICGDAKTTFLTVKTDPRQGDRTLTLATAPDHWRVGDRLVLTGTHFQDETWNSGEKTLEYGGSQDEVVTITEINGNQVSLDQALAYDHDTPRPELKAYVTNFSRNIIFANENPNVPIKQRGHVMFMHADTVDVRYAAFNQLGRTDKSLPLDDFQVDGDGKVMNDSEGNPIAADPKTVTNRRGRYPFHFHRTGIGPGIKVAIAQGNAVWGSPGLGYVHHESHAFFDDNAAYDVYGAAFVSESGDETGRWINNIAIRSAGTGYLKESTRFTHDVGAAGVGFWFQGRIVENKGNVAANQREAGFLYLLRGILRKRPQVETLELAQMAKGATEVEPDIPNIVGFENNEAFGSKNGLTIIKSNPDQSHDVRSVLDGFKAWEIGFEGVHFEYTGKYTMKDWLIMRSQSPLRRGGESSGVIFSTSAVDMVLNRAEIVGFQTGVQQKKQINTLPNDQGKLLDIGDFDFDYVDVTFVDIQGEEISNFDPDEDHRFTRGQLQSIPTRLEISADSDLTVEGDYQDVIIYGTKTDSLGPTLHESRLAEAGAQLGSTYHWQHPHASLYNLIEERGGYYTHDDGRPYFVIEELISDRATGELTLIPIEVELAVPLSELPRNAQNLGTYDCAERHGADSTLTCG